MRIIYILLLLLFAQDVFSMVWTVGVGNLRLANGRLERKGNEGMRFNRTYQHTKKSFINSGERKQGVTYISYEDFALHLAPGTIRHTLIYEDSLRNIDMNIGVIDQDATVHQDWYISDLSDYPRAEAIVNHIEVDKADGLEYFPTSTHALHIPSLGVYEFYELGDLDLFHLGSIETNEDGEEEAWDYDTSLSPVPLEVGYGIYSIITYYYEDNPEKDSTVWREDYDAVGYGTLHLPNDETSKGIKLIFTSLEKQYKDGEVVDEYYYDQIVWYTIDGHYVRATVKGDAWEVEGKAELYDLTWQYLVPEQVTALGSEQLQAATQVYPNPLRAGDWLQVSLPKNIVPNKVVLYDAQGKEVAQLASSSIQKGLFKAQLPQALNAGLYIYKVQNQQGEDVVGGKVVVE